jgi:hypothetical protein
MIIDLADAFELRRLAVDCDNTSNDPRITGNERDTLLRMKHSLFYLALQREWLDGNVA